MAPNSLDGDAPVPIKNFFIQRNEIISVQLALHMASGNTTDSSSRNSITSCLSCVFIEGYGAEDEFIYILTMLIMLSFGSSANPRISALQSPVSHILLPLLSPPIGPHPARFRRAFGLPKIRAIGWNLDTLSIGLYWDPIIMYGKSYISWVDLTFC